MKEIYSSTNDKVAESALAALKEKWNYKYPTIADSCARNWQAIISFLAFPDYIRKAIYTTNCIELINRQIRRIIKIKGAFPNDEAVLN